jgi:putative phosphonoacetaldehyde dehydrogenase/2-aminoethylphosphonate--pyruvate transaminase
MAVESLASIVAGEAVTSGELLEVHNPWNGDLVGTVVKAGAEQLELAIASGTAEQKPLTRYERATVLRRARGMLEERREEIARNICAESGLCMRETHYEVGRTLDVLEFAAMEALCDDGQIFSCDLTAQGKARKIFTVREPVKLVAAITPFNHPLNQVAHKISPAITCGAPVILKPSDKTPMTAIRFANLLFEAGLPGPMLSVLLGDIDAVVTPLIQDERVELVAFTGSVAIGKHIARIAGYKKLCLELGGNSPLIVLDDADLDLAVTLAAEGCFRNSGQRCTAVKRLLIHERVVEASTGKFVERAKTYTCGDPADPNTLVGTVIDEAAAKHLESVVREAVANGAEVLLGGNRRMAQFEPTVMSNVSRQSRMVVQESFGPLAPILTIEDLDDAIKLANGTAYGLSAGIVTDSLSAATRAVKEIRTGTVNVNEVPGYRIESSPLWRGERFWPRHQRGCHRNDEIHDEQQDVLNSLVMDDDENPYLLLTPGPLSTTPSVKRVMMRDWCTWDDDYNVGIVQVIRKKLVQIATAAVDREDRFTTVLMQRSGTFSVESVIGSVIPADGKLLVLANGAYGQRLAKIAARLKISLQVQDSGETSPPDGLLLEKALADDKSITHVALVHGETTTGMLNPLDGIAAAVKSAGRILIVDAMCTFGGVPVDVDQLGIDFIISSANKCIQGVPGFGFIVAKRESLLATEGRARSLSLDLFDQWKTMEEWSGKWRFTSPTHTVRAFAQALEELDEEGGVMARHQRYTQNQRVLTEGMAALGFRSLCPADFQSPIITAFHYPETTKFEFKRFYTLLKQKGFVIYPGKVTDVNTFRIGTIGDVDEQAIRELLEAIEECQYWV